MAVVAVVGAACFVAAPAVLMPTTGSRQRAQRQDRERRGGTFSWLSFPFLADRDLGVTDPGRSALLQAASKRCEHPDTLCLFLVGAEPVSPSLKSFCLGDLRCRGVAFEGFVNLAAEVAATLGSGDRHLCIGGSNHSRDERNAEQRAHHVDRDPLHRVRKLKRVLQRCSR